MIISCTWCKCILHPVIADWKWFLCRRGDRGGLLGGQSALLEPHESAHVVPLALRPSGGVLQVRPNVGAHGRSDRTRRSGRPRAHALGRLHRAHYPAEPGLGWLKQVSKTRLASCWNCGWEVKMQANLAKKIIVKTRKNTGLPAKKFRRCCEDVNINWNDFWELADMDGCFTWYQLKLICLFIIYSRPLANTSDRIAYTKPVSRLRLNKKLGVFPQNVSWDIDCTATKALLLDAIIRRVTVGRQKNSKSSDNC